MWTYNTDYNKWFANDDSISKEDFDYLKQELRSTRFYSRCLSGATYLPVDNLSNMYDILGSYKQRNWYISTLGSQYSITSIPPQHASPIDLSTSYDYYTKYLSEYGLTLKNLFTPYRLIKDASKNFYYVDVAATEQIDLTLITKDYFIDGVKLLDGHRVLVKDQVTSVVLLNTADPNTYFSGNFTIVQDLGATIEYQYYNEQNGIYIYSDGNLVRETDLDTYTKCVRYSVYVKLGNINVNKQFHLSRLLDGYFPTVSLAQPIEFMEKKNWILRNRVDYNNLFEINYYDIIKHDVQSYNYEGVTYSIPERCLSIGEFGVILNTQESKSNIINNKYKVNLRSITQTSKYYWICGDENTLLKVRKHDFNIDRILLENIPTTLPNLIKTNLSSISFFNDLVGVVVGELNTIIYTKNGGYTWTRIEVSEFSDYNYNKVLSSSNSNFYVAGDNGVLIEFIDSVSGWIAYKRRISQIEDDVDEYLLVENINDLYKSNISTWNISYNYYTQSIPTDKELLFLVTNNNKIIAYDINNSFSQIGTDFIYFDFGQEYGDIRNITQRKGTNEFYFTGTEPVSGNDGIFSFDISDFSTLGTGSSYSNTTVGIAATYSYAAYPNEIFDYNSTDLLICGNNSLLGTSDYFYLNFNSLDSTFEDKLKSKLLVVDYDIASKLNFFTDAGDYRLPNSVTFSNSSLDSIYSEIGFKPIEHPQTSTNGGTYSETNWLTYWKDNQKTFEYYSLTPMDESTKVLISTTFSFNSNSAPLTYNNSQITSSASLITLLAPTITMSNLVKNITIKNAGTGYITSASVSTTGGSGTGLTVNIIAASGSITKVTINVKGSGYNVGDVVTISGGSLGQIKINAVEDNYQGRYNGFNLPSITDIPTIGAPSFYRLFIYDYLMVCKVSTSYSVSVGDVMKFESDSVDTEFIVNKVKTMGSWKFLYMYTEFNQNIINDLLNTTNDVKLTNLNKYSSADQFKQRFNTHPISNAYKFDYIDSYNNITSSTSSVLQLSARFNNITSYYNLQTTVSLKTSNTPPVLSNFNFNSGLFATPLSYSFDGGVSTIPNSSAILTASASVNMSPGQYATLVTDGISSTYSFISTGTPGTYDVLIGATLNDTLNSLNTKILTNSFSYISSGSVSGNQIQLISVSSYGSTPNLSSDWRLDFLLYNMAGLTASMNILPQDGDFATIVLSGLTSSYTFRTTPSAINDVLIGTTINSTLVNLNTEITSTVFPTYLFSSVITGNSIAINIKSSYGSIPNNSSNWSLSFSLTPSGIISTPFNMIYTNSFLKFGYSPTYNLLDYLTNINNLNDVNPKFYSSKEYLAMPQYEGLPLGSLTASGVYIDYNGMTASSDKNNQGNKITFGSGLKLEWDSIFVNTFVDVIIHGISDYKTEKLLVMSKYYDSLENSYVLEFHKRLNFNLGDAVIGNVGTLDIISRRHLSQISDDLQELNNIQRTKGKSNSWLDQDLYKYETYENELNFKIPTDSYTKILLSDADTVQSLSSIIYIDYKNELAMNITRLAKEYNISISNTLNFNNKLYISCSEKHDLTDGEGVVLEFTGGAGSSQELNPQYSGYHVITKINEYDFVTDIVYGQTPTIGLDTGFVRYTKQDPFFNYQPVDLIDLGIEGKGKVAIELSVDNQRLLNSVYSLINVDFEKYRFRLIDGLDINTVNISYSWLLEAELSGAVIGLSGNGLVWYKGTWIFGRWFEGTWQSGVWMAGDWYGGTWNSNTITDKVLTADVDTKTVDFEQSFWYTGRWYDGTWNGGIWNGGRWYGGTWNNGMWHKGTWNDGTWNNGRFEGGIWVLGTWNNGIFNCDNEPAYWLDGKWFGGDFENGMWYNGYWEQKTTSSRFGTKSFNSRTSNWQAGTWISGSFYSYLNSNDQGVLDVSDVHKYSIWKTGQWLSGEWYGGIAYNMDFKTGTWYGGILEDIEIIGIDVVNNTFILNGIFKFNIGDTISIIDNQLDSANSVYGSNLNPGVYKVLYQTEDTINKRTILYVDSNLNGPDVLTATDTGLRIVSKFKNLNWKSGIWTNGIYETGLWESGIWYNGVFSGTWS